SFFFSSRRRHTRFSRDWSSDVCSSDLCFYISGVKPILKDHAQFDAMVLTGRDQSICPFQADFNRLFKQHMFTRFSGRNAWLHMGSAVGTDADHIDSGVCQKFLQLIIRRDPKFLLCLLCPGFRAATDCDEFTPFISPNGCGMMRGDGPCSDNTKSQFFFLHLNLNAFMCTVFLFNNTYRDLSIYHGLWSINYLPYTICSITQLV